MVIAGNFLGSVLRSEGLRQSVRRETSVKRVPINGALIPTCNVRLCNVNTATRRDTFVT